MKREKDEEKVTKKVESKIEINYTLRDAELNRVREVVMNENGK